MFHCTTLMTQNVLTISSKHFLQFFFLPLHIIELLNGTLSGLIHRGQFPFEGLNFFCSVLECGLQNGDFYFLCVAFTAILMVALFKGFQAAHLKFRIQK